MAESTQDYLSIDFKDLPKHFDFEDAEKKWDETWEASGIYHWDESKSRDETFVVDTPPPTVSGSLHVGHVFSYTHTDILARYQRLQGKNIFYPMGWDDNGLPTERRVQNYYHIRCDPNTPYVEGLKLEQAPKKPEGHPKLISRKNFIEYCHGLTQEDEKVFEQLFRRIALSVDWRQTYATIDDHSRKLAQLSFLDLFEKNHVYSNEAPTMWDVDFQTAVAQAEVEDREKPGAFHDIRFGVEGSEESFVIATTRPELLAACVGVTAHPEDERFKGLFGKKAVTPLFHVPVPIFPSELADPEKGTGILMVCTFGDQTDVQWWKEEGLVLRQILGRNGRLLPVEYGTEGWESLKPEMANTYYKELEGKNVKQAQKKIVELLRLPEGASFGDEAPLQGDPKPINHAVKFFEKGERPLEFVSTRQWFVKLMDKKDQLLTKGREIDWHPSFMHERFKNWTENLGLDWCISRQRYFGVAFPVWYRLDGEGEINYDSPIVAAQSQLPVDPTSECPDGYSESQRNQPNGFVAESDVFDTWFTSSLTPQIGSHWDLNKDRHEKLFPADVRPQSHEIIRTWAFYTIAKAMLHEDKVPWSNVAISGWILDPDRKKMSKSRGNVVVPIDIINQFSADAVRYWAGSASLGVDTAFDEKKFKIGKRLQTKIFNASKFVLGHSSKKSNVETELDRAFVAKLRGLITESTKHFEDFNFAHALMNTESFFWQNFTDTYIELAKNRARETGEGQGSAVATLRLGLSALLRMLSPFQPYITEEVWSWVFAKEMNLDSIHKSSWPALEDYKTISPPEYENSFDVAVNCFGAINKKKTEYQKSMGAEVLTAEILVHPKTLPILKSVQTDVFSATKVAKAELVEDEKVEAGQVEVRQMTFPEA